MEIGKQFEQIFKKNWEETVGDSFQYRLNDQMSGYMGSSNISYFICYKKPDLFLIECKTHLGNTFPFSAFRQYEGLLEWKGVSGVHAGVILWMRDHDLVLWIPVETFEKLRKEDKKSFNIKLVGNPEYESLVLPSKKKRKFLDTDYSALIDYYKEE